MTRHARTLGISSYSSPQPFRFSAETFDALETALGVKLDRASREELDAAAHEYEVGLQLEVNQATVSAALARIDELRLLAVSITQVLQADAGRSLENREAMGRFQAEARVFELVNAPGSVERVDPLGLTKIGYRLLIATKAARKQISGTAGPNMSGMAWRDLIRTLQAFVHARGISTAAAKHRFNPTLEETTPFVRFGYAFVSALPEALRQHIHSVSTLISAISAARSNRKSGRIRRQTPIE